MSYFISANKEVVSLCTGAVGTLASVHLARCDRIQLRRSQATNSGWRGSDL